MYDYCGKIYFLQISNSELKLHPARYRGPSHHHLPPPLSTRTQIMTTLENNLYNTDTIWGTYIDTLYYPSFISEGLWPEETIVKDVI